MDPVYTLTLHVLKKLNRYKGTRAEQHYTHSCDVGLGACRTAFPKQRGISYRALICGVGLKRIISSRVTLDWGPAERRFQNSEGFLNVLFCGVGKVPNTVKDSSNVPEDERCSK
jgi:hypothetical protein